MRESEGNPCSLNAVSPDDISVIGARINSSTLLALPDASPVTLIIILKDSDITLVLRAEVNRQEDRDIGIMFDRPPVDNVQHLRSITMLHQGDYDEYAPTTLLTPEA